MTNTEFYNLIQSNITDNTTGDITPLKLRALLDDISNRIGGNVYYANSSSTHQSLPSGVETTLTNDGASGFTVTQYKPHYADIALWSNNRVHFDDLINGSTINTRLELEFVTGANTEIEVEAIFYGSVGVEVFRLLVEDVFYKASGTHSKTVTFDWFMDSNITNGYMLIKSKPDSTITGLLKSIYLDVQ